MYNKYLKCSVLTLLCSGLISCAVTDKDTGNTTSFSMMGSSFKSGASNINDEMLSKFVKGKTTYKEVITTIGVKPTSDRLDKKVFNGKEYAKHYVTYVAQESKTEKDTASMVPIVGSFIGSSKTTASSKFYTFIFDPKTDILENYSTMDNGESSSQSKSAYDTLQNMSVSPTK